jgi:hypothetical protein
MKKQLFSLFSLLSLSALAVSSAYGGNTTLIPITSVDTSNVANSRSIVISGLPKGSAITSINPNPDDRGNATIPKLDNDGQYFSLVDSEKLSNGELALSVQNGFFGDINLDVLSFNGSNATNLSATQVGSFEKTVAPNTEHMLFAQSGSIAYNNSQMESGTVVISGSIDSGVYSDITFNNSYVDPVVIAYIGSRNGGQEVDVRVTNVSSTGARLFMKEPDSGPHLGETITYIIAESGRYTLPDGTKVEARNHNTRSIHRGGQPFSGDQVSFGQHFSTPPVVLHTVNSTNDWAFRSSVAHNLTKDGFRLQQEVAEVQFGQQYTSDLKVALRSFHGLYFVAENNGGGALNANRPHMDAYETFYLRATTDIPNCIVNGDTVTIRTTTGQYWVAESNKDLNANRGAAGLWEQFTLINNDQTGCLQAGNNISLRAYTGKYVTAKNNGETDVNANSLEAWERIDVVSLAGTFGNKEETIGWLAIEAGREGEINGAKFKTDNIMPSANYGVDDGVATIDLTALPVGKIFNQPRTPFSFDQVPNLIVDGHSGNGTDGYWLRSGGTTTKTSATVFTEEDQQLDSERNHPAESLSYIAFEGSFNVSSSKRVPLDIIVNPLLFPITLTVSDIPDNAKLYRPDGSLVNLAGGSFIAHAAADVKGLSLEIGNVNSDFNVGVHLSGQSSGTTYYSSKNIFINTADIAIAQNGDASLAFSGNRNSYSIERVANAFVVTPTDQLNNITRVQMMDVNRLRFANGVVSSEQFYKNINIANVINNQTITDNSFVIVKDIPIGAIVNNSVALGNGAFAVAANTINLADPLISIDFSKLDDSTELNVKVEVNTMTEADTDFLNGQGRLHGYVNAQAMAEAGVEASGSIGLDGVSAEARAYVEAGAVATAGGSVSIGGVTASGEVESSVTVKAEIAGRLEVDENGAFVSLGASAEASATAGASVSLAVDYIPGTEYTAGGEATVRMYAEVGAEGEVGVGDGKYGASFEGGAEAGIMVEANGYGSASLGGVGAGAGAGVSAGLGAGASGGGTAMYDNGEITVGVSGDVALLVGIDVDIDVTVDTGAVEDTAYLVAEGYMTVNDAVADSFITAGDAINAGLLSTEQAIDDGLMTVDNAINSGFMSADNAIRSGYINVTDAVSSGFINSADALAAGLTAGADVVDGVLQAGKDFFCSIMC